MPKWQPEVITSNFKVSVDEANILLEELAIIFYDYFASLEKSNNKTRLTESKLKEENDFVKRTGSDG